MFEQLKKSKLLKFLFAAKSLLLVGLWISFDKIKLGDIPSIAAEEKSAPKDDKDKGDKAAAADPKSNAEGTTAAADAPTPDAPKRRSFLDDLLNLPELDPGTIKREELGRYLTIAEKKKRQVEERVELLKRRESQLVQLEKAIDDKLLKLDEERKFFSQTIQREKDLKGERLDKLVELYDKMEPKKAAPVFEKMDKDLVVSLFKRLKQKQITIILETMNPTKSVELSEYFGRLRSGREYEMLKEMNSSLKQEFQDCKGMPEQAAAQDAENATKKVAEAAPTPTAVPRAVADAPKPAEAPALENPAPTPTGAQTAPAVAAAPAPTSAPVADAAMQPVSAPAEGLATPSSTSGVAR